MDFELQYCFRFVIWNCKWNYNFEIGIDIENFELGFCIEIFELEILI